MISTKQAQLIQFLRWELAIPASSIAMALRHPEQESGQLPMILWQYGLVTLEQLDKIFDWLEQFGNTPDLKSQHQSGSPSREATRNPMPLTSSSYVA
ncbi:DUF2949 domain-containing protein [Lyngbya sp. CCY1209]|jgi:hypothetical protein|uniref:DUF2949 domain-containing protein n=1 Tax=Lyngbya sp. CCY1209 TaxID=2886103 RepID=UPI002D20ED28|nr:DUF2949 domain-containing protein [Lyngbya sp. CCY1209]MEB3884392.1 DUF2949 domain-containing protein [Lyngbya sp. CCY1209]